MVRVVSTLRESGVVAIIFEFHTLSVGLQSFVPPKPG
jgi:hypothetical protein